MGNGNKFLLLLWKNYLIQKRKIFTTILEIAFPTFFGLILVLIRLRVTGQQIPDGMNWTACSNLFVMPGLSYPNKVAFTPDTPLTQSVMKKVNDSMGFFKDIQGFKTEDEMVDFLIFANKTVNNTAHYLGGIVFNSKTKGNQFVEQISYKIRLSSFPRHGSGTNKLNPAKQDKEWFTEFMFPLYQVIGPRDKASRCGSVPGYYKEGFLALQTNINKAIYETVIGNDTAGLQRLMELDDNIQLRRHPYPPYNDDKFVLVIQQQFPLILILSFVLVALNVVKDVVHEKERKLKESMKMMGLNSWLHWVAWFTKYFIFLLITSAVMTIFLTMNTAEGRVIGKTNPLIIFLFLLCFSMATIAFCFLVSSFFSKANSGAAAGGIIFFLSYIPYLFIQQRYATLSWGAKIASSLVSNIAMSYGGQVIGMFEGTGAGVQWSTIDQGASVDDNFAMLHIIVMLLVDTVLYMMITVYIEGVFPGEYGTPLKWYFPFTKSYWCGTAATDDVPDDKRISIGQNPDFFETDPVGIRPGVQIRNLKKVFGRKEKCKVAVAGMSLDLYEGQITALLGHNGAGKTTTMSMLTGFLPPTSGTALVNGFDIREDITSVRSSLGLCPQHDVLFDTMTVEEHLIFFAKLKGCPSNKVSQEVEDMLSAINLTNKRNAQSKTLSGGMKRKLSVGIALIAGSKIVILDEPSSGLDPDARRQIWTVLQKNRAGRTMLLTTHFMDEADLLGDRIAIMADGILKCCGSSLFLKNKYGAGYHMVIVKEPHCDVDQVTTTVKKYVRNAEEESNIGAELSFRLPYESTGNFQDLFEDLEHNKQKYGISSYGASVTTMEEVFIRVGEGTDKSLNGIPVHHKENISLDLTVDGSSTELDISADFEHNKDTRLQIQQFYGMFVKRALHTLRNKLVSATQILIPLFFTVMALIVVKTFPGPHDSKALTLDVEKYGVNTIVYSDNGFVNQSVIGQFYANQFQSSKDHVNYVNKEQGYTKNPDINDYLFRKGEDSLGLYNLEYAVGADFAKHQNSVIATAYFNNQGYHAPAISLATLANAVFQYVTNSSQFTLTTVNHPLPRTKEQKIREETQGSTTGFTIAFNFVFGMAFLSSSFVLFLIKERATKAKHIQFVSGVQPFTFWASTFCWDLINYMIPCCILLFVLWAFGIEAYYIDAHAVHILLLMFLHGWAMLPFMYLLSFIFTVPSSGFVWLTMFNILAGDATVLAVGILGIPQLGLKDLSNVLEWIFLVFLPNFCLGQGLMDYYSNWEFLDSCKDFQQFCSSIPNPCCGPINGQCGELGCVYYNNNYIGWEKNGIGRILIFLTLQGIVYFAILLFVESNLFKTIIYFFKSGKTEDNSETSISETTPLLQGGRVFVAHQPRQYQSSQIQEDSDVAAERGRLHMSKVLTDSLILKEVTKYYGQHLAVNHISVGIPQGECFGLLGVNGAGKTTTFKMLTGDEIMTTGEAYLNGQSVKSELAMVRQNLGYCPQYDALIDQMTGRETLCMFARLRGIKEEKIPGIVEGLMAALLMKEHADKMVKAYSGGNKRKLSTAVALVGNPQVIFLDEPTTGMDPVARRYLWNALINVRDAGRTLILTSHSMEECEALCTRLAIMVNGEFRCLGGTQHLKNKFGQGYTLLARIAFTESGEAPDLRPFINFVESKFPGSELKDMHQGMVTYHIARNSNLTLGTIFGILESAKSEFHIEDYSVSQTTLEQVFINFARSQIPSREVTSGCCSGFCSCLCCNTHTDDE
ncbi:phospholipid-transporting ATPase ABCA3-like isoform X2 [Ostrea edulis]|uniref:phospholipid-transporting ATPase ABCA3-like isoform X2 n=1 Tax=Ostrea edulis TaxID=37623 RepID=UPI0024AEB643|nr:phospholipid-transporting ATPase ABCA3-like isoform X2 [Ostrea edulis]XP_056019365.1 phospholipid-transporting ATPase ABCA3-like isoform X2 [Ostrea edulis]